MSPENILPDNIKDPIIRTLEQMRESLVARGFLENEIELALREMSNKLESMARTNIPNGGTRMGFSHTFYPDGSVDIG